MNATATTTKTTTRTRINPARWRKPWMCGGKMKKGYWYIRDGESRINLSPYGAPRKNSGKRDQREADKARDKWLTATNANLQRAELVTRSIGVTMGKVLRTYEEKKLPEAGKTWRENASRLIDNFCEGHDGNPKRNIRPYRGWKNLPVANMSAIIVDEWKGHHNWETAGFRSAVMLLKAALNHAVKTGTIKSNPIAGIETKQSVADASPFSETEEKTYRKAAVTTDKAYAFYWQFLMDTGARPKEISSATVANVLTTGSGNMVIKLTEWKNSKKGTKPRPRIIHIPAKWRTFITKRTKTADPTAPIFTTRYGKAWGQNNRERVNRMVCDKAGMSKGLYDCRHTRITRLLKGGMSAGNVATACGTSEDQIRATYNHLIDEVDHLAALLANVNN